MTDYIDLFSHLFHTSFSGDLGLPSLCPQLRSWVPLPGTSVDTFITGLAAFNQLLPSPILPLPHSRVIALKPLIPPLLFFQNLLLLLIAQILGPASMQEPCQPDPKFLFRVLAPFGPYSPSPTHSGFPNGITK